MAGSKKEISDADTLRYNVPFKGTVLVSIEGNVGVGIPAEMRCPKRRVASAVLYAARENGLFDGTASAFEEILPNCKVTIQTIGCLVDEPHQTSSELQDRDLVVCRSDDDESEEVQS